jgi:hypothetical protein
VIISGEKVRILDSNLHLYTAAVEDSKILVFLGFEMIGSGKIEGITDLSVQVNGVKYPKENCIFYAVG